MNEAKIEGLLVVRDTDNKIIAVISKDREFEIYTTEVASIEEVKDIINNKQNEPKI